MPEPRRSGRQRKVNPRYANGGWDKETLRILRAESESSGSSPAEESASSDSDNGSAGNHVSAREDDGESLASVASIHSSDVETPDQEEDGGEMSAASSDDAPGPKRRSHLSRRHVTHAGESTRSRGIQPPSQLGKGSAYGNIFGPEFDDLCDVLIARDTWLQGQDITIPSRQTLSSAIQQSHDLEQSIAGSNEDSATEKQDISAVGSLFETVRNQQVLEVIDEKAVYEKYLLHDVPGHSIVLGAWGKQIKFGLGYLSCLDLGKAWLDHEKFGDAGTSHTTELAAQRPYHQAWLLNVGEKVQCFAWAVGTRPVQYLAVAVKCTSSQRQMAPFGKECERPAFHPSPAYPTSIQIWAFHTKSTSTEGLHTLAIDEEPSLAVVIGTEWGNIRQLRWCQLDPDTESSHNNTINPLIGLLATVSSDGHARVIAVPRPESRNARTPVALRVERAGFDIPPPADTVFTTLAFADATNLMLGTADGFLHCFDLTAPVSQEKEQPQCYLKQQLHHTYIVSICPGFPGPQSPFVASTSASGDLALTDLRSPEQDRVHVPRPSFPTRDLFYAPFTRSFISVLDRSGNTQIERNAATFLAGHHIRQFPSLVKIAKLSHDTGAAAALAGSKWHPCIAVGNAKGQVLATNYLRKVLPYRKSDPKKAVGAYLQKICEYDWRPLTLPQDQSHSEGDSSLAGAGKAKEDDTPDIYHGHDARPGMSRFHEGFKPDKIEVGYIPSNTKKAKSKPTKKADARSGGTDAGIGGEAVFEEEQAVTALEWNPNAACAGLMAMGWASGIVRVQDLTYDAK